MANGANDSLITQLGWDTVTASKSEARQRQQGRFGMASNGTPALVRAGRAIARQLDVTWLAVAALIASAVVVTVVLTALRPPSVGAAAAAYGLGLATVVLFIYAVELVGTQLGWQVVIDADRDHLPHWFRNPVLPFVALAFGLLFGHFVW